MDEHLVPIGRFATATRLSVTTLRHYDDIGLLRPAVVDPTTGYRYYHLGQASSAEAIRVLRGVDMPLDDVAELLAAIDDDGDRVRKLLDQQRQRLHEELERHRGMLEFLERLLTQPETIMPHQVTHETLPATTLATLRTRTTMDGLSSALDSGFGRVFGVLAAQGQAPTGPPLVRYPEMPGDEPAEIEIAIPCDPGVTDADGVTVTTLDPVEAAVTVHHGPYDQLAPAYHALSNWIAEQGREPTGPPREVYVTDPGETAQADLRTRIEWPIG